MTRRQMWLGVRHLFSREPATIDRGRIIYSGLRPEAPHWLTIFWSLKRLTMIVHMSGGLTLFMDMSYCGPHCKQVKRVGLLIESRKTSRGTEEADRGRKMVRGREPAE